MHKMTRKNTEKHKLDNRKMMEVDIISTKISEL